MNYISPRTWELIEILDKALLRLNLKTHSSSKLRKSVAEKEELEDFIGKAWDLYSKNIMEGLEKEILLTKYTAPTKLSTPKLNTGSIREIMTDQENCQILQQMMKMIISLLKQGMKIIQKRI